MVLFLLVRFTVGLGFALPLPKKPGGDSPKTGYFRTGCRETGPQDRGSHVICAEVTEEFLRFTRSTGNDLSSPAPESGFPGLKPGDRWCLCAAGLRQGGSRSRPKRAPPSPLHPGRTFRAGQRELREGRRTLPSRKKPPIHPSPAGSGRIWSFPVCLVGYGISKSLSGRRS